jgi:hypothetical protein
MKIIPSCDLPVSPPDLKKKNLPRPKHPPAQKNQISEIESETLVPPTRVREDATEQTLRNPKSKNQGRIPQNSTYPAPKFSKECSIEAASRA